MSHQLQLASLTFINNCHYAQVKLVDAGFIWTEPHSRRLKTKLTVQSEVFNGAILQQTFVVEYVVETHMCPDCSKAAANPNTWTAVVQVRRQLFPHRFLHSFHPCQVIVVIVDAGLLQVRQHTEHKRTFMFLEQVVLKYSAAANCINIKDIHEVNCKASFCWLSCFVSSFRTGLHFIAKSYGPLG